MPDDGVARSLHHLLRRALDPHHPGDGVERPARCRCSVFGAAAHTPLVDPGRGDTVKIAMVTEGTYPVRTGGVSTWCDQLLRGMPQHDWSVVTLTALPGEPTTWPLPPSVSSAVQHPLWGPWRATARRRRTAQVLHTVRGALTELWAAALGPDDETSVIRAEEALHTLVTGTGSHSLAALLADQGSTAVLIEAWQQQTSPAPPLSVADAVAAAGLVDRTLAAVDAPVPAVDLVHTTGNGTAALVGLATLWRRGTPFLLSEHGVYLRERYLALDDGQRSWSQRRAVTAVLRRICEVAYRRATAILPVSDFNARWAVRLGADPRRVLRIHNGVAPETHAPVETEPAVPTISFVGRIDPLKDLHTLIRAFALVVRDLPAARLRLFGPVPEGNEAYRDSLVELVAQLGLGSRVVFEGPSPGSRPAIAAGSVVALSSISEGLPFSVVEAMMCGRATVSTDVGGVAECLDAEQTAGRVVPSRDPVAFAAACLELLTDDDLRRRTGARAREHALSSMTLDRCLRAYETVYATATQRLPVTVDRRRRARPSAVLSGRHRVAISPPVRSATAPLAVAAAPVSAAVPRPFLSTGLR